MLRSFIHNYLPTLNFNFPKNVLIVQEEVILHYKWTDKWMDAWIDRRRMDVTKFHS